MRLRVRVIPLLMPLLVGAAISATILGVQPARGVPPSDGLRILLQRHANVIREIETKYVRELDPETLTRATVSGMLVRLDPHSNLFVPRNYRQMRERQQGGYVGLGIRVQHQNGLLTVVSPFEGTPAYRLGIRAGDVISRIEGVDATQYTMDEAVTLLRGPRGTPVSITITRPGYDAPLDFTVIRDRIPLKSVPYYFVLDEPTGSEKTGYVRISDFNENTDSELRDAIVELRLGGATRLLVDLRHNPGGLLNQAVAVSNVFLKQHQEVVAIRGRHSENDQVFHAEDPSPYSDLPVIVLVSRESASASEIVAGAVQDHDRGLILGENTYGKGLVQSVFQLKYGYALGLTSAEYFTPSGRRLQRDYESGDFLEYFQGRGEHDSNDEAGTIVLTELGREIRGGGGVAPDIEVPAPELPEVVVEVEQHGAFFRFATRFVPADGRGAVDGAGTRPDELEARGDLIRAVDQSFRVDETIVEEFFLFLSEERIPHDREGLDEHRDAVALRIEGAIFSLLWGPAASREATMDRDPQIAAALQAMSQAALLLNDPEAYLAGATGGEGR